MTDTINNSIPLVPENTVDPAAGLNLALNTIDPLLQCAVLNKTNTPAVGPADGDRYIVGTVPTGVWVGHADKLATYLDGAWHYQNARIVVNLNDNLLYTRGTAGWVSV